MLSTKCEVTRKRRVSIFSGHLQWSFNWTRSETLYPCTPFFSFVVFLNPSSFKRTTRDQLEVLKVIKRKILSQRNAKCDISRSALFKMNPYFIGLTPQKRVIVAFMYSFVHLIANTYSKEMCLQDFLEILKTRFLITISIKMHAVALIH